MTAHTPGPWQVQITPTGKNYQPGEAVVEVYGSPSFVAAVGPYGSDVKKKREANAALIAAAPELADALEAIYCAELELMQLAGVRIQDDMADPVGRVWHQVVAALRKAGRLS